MKKISKSKPFKKRPGADEFPLQVVLSFLYVCNLKCPLCPYTDGNSEIRQFYQKRKGLFFPLPLFKKIARECGQYHAFIRCTGGGEPTLHPQFFEMAEYAKKVGARLWLTTNGTLLGPQSPKAKKNLEFLIDIGCDMLEFSVDAGDAETYSKVRPMATRLSPEERWNQIIETVRYALQYRNARKKPVRIVCSIIMDDLLGPKATQAVKFWREEVGVDDVITRKFLTWDQNTKLDFKHALDPKLYAKLNAPDRTPVSPCVWLFERLNVDTLGRIALCGQDISFTTAPKFPNVKKTTIKEIWQGPVFQEYRKFHLIGRADSIFPCKDCSAWKAGIRDWDHGWLKVLKTTGKKLSKNLKKK